MKKYPPKEEVSRAMMEVIPWHLVDPTSEYLIHHALCERADVNVKARDLVPYLKD